jgi:hypothetical protein
MKITVAIGYDHGFWESKEFDGEEIAPGLDPDINADEICGIIRDILDEERVDYCFVTIIGVYDVVDD